MPKCSMCGLQASIGSNRCENCQNRTVASFLGLDERHSLGKKRRLEFDLDAVEGGTSFAFVYTTDFTYRGNVS
jgi:hypothetical protein